MFVEELNLDCESISSISEGSDCFSKFKVIYNGKSYFFKYLNKDVKKNVKKGLFFLDNIIKKFVFQDFSLQDHIVSSIDRKDLIKKEISTWELWKILGISTPELYKFSEKKVFYEYIENAISYKDLLVNDFLSKEFDKFLELYDKIRNIAKKDKNPMVLHSDPHLGNFIYDTKKMVAMPIDSGVLLNPKMSFDKIDTNLLAFTMNSIASLETNQSNICNYLRKFKEILNNKDISSLLDINANKINMFGSAYLIFREEFVYRIKKREKNNPIFIFNNIVDQYNNVIKPILTE